MLLPAPLKALLPAPLHPLCEGAWYARRARLFRMGTQPVWMFYVVSGEVTLERSGRQGEAVVLQRMRQGFVSEASLRVARYHCDALAVVDTTVVKVPVHALANELQRDPGFASRWIDMLNSEVRRLRLLGERLRMKSVRDRVLHLLHTEGHKGAYTAATGLKSLAAELGVTHEALYRSLAALGAAGLIERQGNTLKLLPG